jgi:hypothetical protein
MSDLARPCPGVAIILLPAANLASATTHFGDVDRPAGGDGLDCAAAYTDLQDAPEDARANAAVDGILVADGTYFADRGSTDWVDIFALVSGIALNGDFAGKEDALAGRDPAARPAILSSDL